VQTLPVLELREPAMRLGLLRRYRGMLLATAAAGSSATIPPASGGT
jgi:hypothetical protein